MARNLELKVRCDASLHAHILDHLKLIRADQPTVLSQLDTYFFVRVGRLKLRETASVGSDSAELIQYSRPDVSGMRLSSYQRFAIAPSQASTLRTALIESIGLLTSVEKTRTVVIWRSTRIHLDEVTDLGHFVELETVLAETDEDGTLGREEYETLVAMLGLESFEAISGSYSDLMFEEKGTL